MITLRKIVMKNQRVGSTIKGLFTEGGTYLQVGWGMPSANPINEPQILPHEFSNSVNLDLESIQHLIPKEANAYVLGKYDEHLKAIPIQFYRIIWEEEPNPASQEHSEARFWR